MTTFWIAVFVGALSLAMGTVCFRAGVSAGIGQRRGSTAGILIGALCYCAIIGCTIWLVVAASS